MKNKIYKLIPFILVSMIALTACSRKSSYSVSSVANSSYLTSQSAGMNKSAGFDGYAERAVMETAAAAEMYEDYAEPAPSASQKFNVNENRKLIRRINMSVVSENDSEMAGAVNDISGLVIKNGGYIENEYVEKGLYATGNLTARIPKDKTDAFLNELKSESYLIQSFSDNLEDVTLQYTDTESRLESSRAAKKRYMDLLDKAESVEDIITIQSKIDSIIAEEESYQRQLNTLSSQIDYTTVYIGFSCKVNEEKQGFSEKFRNALDYIAEDAGDVLIEGIEWFVSAIIWLVFIIPILFIFIRAIMFIFRFRRKKTDKETKEKKGFFKRKKKEITVEEKAAESVEEKKPEEIQEEKKDS